MSKKICYVTTIESPVIHFLLPQLEKVSKRYDVAVALNTNQPDFLRQKGISIRVVPIRIERDISLWRDARALASLFFLFRKEHFDMVQSLMPKAGLLAMLAGCLAGVPVRSHIFTGQVWVTRRGFMRCLLKRMDWLLARCATHLLSDSPSQRRFLIEQGIVKEERIRTLHKGSMCGVDVDRFHPDEQTRARLRMKHGIPDEDVVFLYVGRLNRDKGMLDLARAFQRLAKESFRAWLIVVGPEEEKGIVRTMRDICGPCEDRVIFTGFCKTPEHYMAASDVLCLPSYRESFGDVIIEAAAVGLPAIATRIYGVENDTVVDSVHGLLHDPGDVDALAGAMRRLAEDVELRRRLGEQARERAIRDFSSEQVTRAWMDYYSALL